MSIVGDVGAAQLGHRIAQLRDRAQMKQAELARKIEWSQAVLSRVEAGERAVSDDELGTLLDAIGTPEAAALADILGWHWRFLPRPALDHPDQDLLRAAEILTAELSQLAEKPDVRTPFERRVRTYISEIGALADPLLRRDHQIALVGAIGIGKSTAICRATALEVEGPQGRPLPVLETGGGGVTLCEVHLRRGLEYGLTIEPRSHDDIRIDVTDFVEQLRRAQGDGGSTQEDDSLRAVPREIERAIRNMAGLTPKRSKGPDGKTTRSDPALDLLAATASNREIVVEVLALMALHRRDRRDARYEPSDASEPLVWLKSMFEQINNGRHPDFSLPARIDLVVPELIQVADLDISVVDTRGIDQVVARADLEAHLEDPHTVVILCSGFNAAPEQSVLHLLKRARDIRNPYVDSNCSIVVLPRPEEALAVKDESGLRVDSAEDGYELKEEQVHAALSPYGLQELPIGFFNAFEDAPERLRGFLVERVEHTRGEFRRRLEEVLADARSLLDNAEQEEVQAIQREAARLIRSWIEEHPEPLPVKRHVHDALLTEIASAHPSTVHAAVRRDGEWQSLSYSHQLGYGARRIAVAALADAVTAFMDLCKILERTYPEASELLAQASRLMGTSYEDLLRKVQLAGLTLYSERLQRDTQLWNDLLDEWGRGPGYRDRVTGRNREWFDEAERREVEAETVKVLTREWEHVLRRIASIFDVA